MVHEVEARSAIGMQAGRFENQTSRELHVATVKTHYKIS